MTEIARKAYHPAGVRFDRSPAHTVSTPLTARTPQVFRIAGEAGGIKKSDEMLPLSILPRFAVQC